MAREIVLIYIAAIAFLLAAPARASVTISQADLSCREGTFAGTHTGVGMYVQVWEGGASAPFYEEYFSGGNGGFNDMVVDLGQEFPQGTVLYWYVYARTSTQNWDGEAYFETQQACDGLHKQAQRCIAGISPPSRR